MTLTLTLQMFVWLVQLVNVSEVSVWSSSCFGFGIPHPEFACGFSAVCLVLGSLDFFVIYNISFWHDIAEMSWINFA